MSRDLVISCMGVRQLPDWLPWAGEPPALIEWPGKMGAGGHPGWSQVARSLRDSDGAVLPRLLATYRKYLGFDLDGANRIAVVGFSAGSNSGVRELLRSPLDRARLSWVAAVDGLHPMLSMRNPTPAQVEADPTALYQDWRGQMEPLARFALDAADAQGPGCLVTASEVQPTNRQIAPTGGALASLARWVGENRTGPRAPPEIPKGYPPRARSQFLKPGEPPPEPIAAAGANQFAALWYPGATARAHQLQAWVVVPDLLRAFLVPQWGGPVPALVGFAEPASSPGELVTSSAQPLTRGVPVWARAAFAAASVAAVAFV